MKLPFVMLVIGGLCAPAFAQTPPDGENPLNTNPQPTPVTPPEPTFVAPPPPPPPPPPPADNVDPTKSPQFLTIKRYDGSTRFGGEFVYPLLKGGTSIAPKALYRFEFHGQYVTPDGIGFYGQVPINILHVDEQEGVATADTGFGIGNVEIGGLYAIRRTARPDTGVILHFGIMAPTANKPDSDPLDTADGFKANFAGVNARFMDGYAALPRGLSVRAGVSPMWRQGKLFGRADLGFDFNIDVENGDKFAKNRAKPLIHFNLGFGYDHGSFSVGGELQNLFVVSDRDDLPLSTNTLAVNVRLPRGELQPYFGMSFPIDQEASVFMDAILILGLDFAPKAAPAP